MGMSGYCKENGDCHCGAPKFATDGSTCKLACSPDDASNPCCRDDNDCKKDGDNDAYCKSLKGFNPGNGMCRCSAPYTGTTSCKKSVDEAFKSNTTVSAPMKCKKDEDCPGSYCQNGVCHGSCNNDQDCPGSYCQIDKTKKPPYFCHGTQLVTELPSELNTTATRECKSDKDCPCSYCMISAGKKAPYFCHGSVCCKSDKYCPGSYCMNSPDKVA